MILVIWRETAQDVTALVERLSALAIGVVGSVFYWKRAFRKGGPQLIPRVLWTITAALLTGLTAYAMAITFTGQWALTAIELDILHFVLVWTIAAQLAIVARGDHAIMKIQDHVNEYSQKIQRRRGDDRE